MRSWDSFGDPKSSVLLLLPARDRAKSGFSKTAVRLRRSFFGFAALLWEDPCATTYGNDGGLCDVDTSGRARKCAAEPISFAGGDGRQYPQCVRIWPADLRATHQALSRPDCGLRHAGSDTACDHHDQS